jgi:hypothetical protein
MHTHRSRKEDLQMRPLAFSVLSAACLVLLAACSTTRMPTGATRTAHMSDCPEMEGYPDCQNGHRVDLRLASGTASLAY